MRERMLNYLAYMDGILKDANESCKKDDKDYKKIMENHMIQIGFFMHERLIHLLVTILFAIGAFMTIFTYLIVDNIGLLLLAFLLIILLVPYIRHYYLLENGVQKMYKQYDQLLLLLHADKNNE